MDPSASSAPSYSRAQNAQGYTPRRIKKPICYDYLNALPETQAKVIRPEAVRQRRRRPEEPMTPADIENMRRMINAARPRTIYSRDTSNCMFNEKILTGDPLTGQETRPKSIIVDGEPIDINEAPKATRLISTTASVLDYIGVPNSLSFIR
jgi:hypothetical protein